MSTTSGESTAADTSNEGGEESASSEEVVGTTPTRGDSLDDVADAAEQSEEESQDEGAEDEGSDDEGSDDSDGGDSESDDDSDSGDDEEESDDDSGDDSDEEDSDEEDDSDSDDESDEDEDSESDELDIDNLDHFNIAEDKKYGIAPIKIPKEFEKNESVKKLHNAIIENSLQAFKNLVGVANKQQAQQQAEAQKQQSAQAKGWVKEIDQAVKAGQLGEYELLSDGRIDANSDGGKEIADIFEYMETHNESNPKSPITSFDVARRLYQADKSAQDKSDKKKQEQQTRKKKAGKVGGSGRSGTKRKGDFSDAPSKGLSLDDINDSLDLE